jgi:hypothetical protein
MPYPESCFTDLIGIRGICEPPGTTPLYWVDDIPGVSLENLAKIVNASATHTGKEWGFQLIERAARMMAADVEAIYDGTYKVENMLVNGCSSCTFLANYATGAERGVLIKNNTDSAFARLVIDKITAKVNDTGTFTIVIDDGESERLIPVDFEAGVILDIINVNYQTRRKEVRIYLLESNVPLAQLSCPRKTSGCGCSGKSIVVDTLIYTGTAGGTESQQAYGFQPCAFIRCEADDLLCYTAHSAPRMIGMGLLYKVGELYFADRLHSTRNNRLGGTDNDTTEEEMKRYNKLYTDKLNGKGTRGVKDLVKTALGNVNDVCVVCDAKMGTAWATT